MCFVLKISFLFFRHVKPYFLNYNSSVSDSVYFAGLNLIISSVLLRLGDSMGLRYPKMMYQKCHYNRAKSILVVFVVESGPCPLHDLNPTLDSITLNETEYGPQKQLFIDA